MTDIVERLRAECDDWHTTADRRSAEIVRLNNEIERLRVKARETEADYQRATDDLATLSAMCDALRADAERYRWLREHNASDGRIHLTYVGAAIKRATTPKGEMLDAAIDAAMANDPSK